MSSHLFFQVLLYVHACLPTFMYVYHVHAWYPQRPEEGFGCPGPGVVGAPEPPCRNWEENLGLCRNCWVISPAPCFLILKDLIKEWKLLDFFPANTLPWSYVPSPVMLLLAQHIVSNCQSETCIVSNRNRKCRWCAPCSQPLGRPGGWIGQLLWA